MGTRYSKGDVVRLQEGRYAGEKAEVVNIKEPESDSPIYAVRFKDNNIDVGQSFHKASELKKADVLSREEIINAFEEAIVEKAQQHASVTQSEILNEDANMIVAKFGDKIGVNGYEKRETPDLTGYRKTEEGEMSYDEYAEVDEALELAYRKLDADFENDRVEEVIFNEYEEKQEYYREVSGTVTYYKEE